MATWPFAVFNSLGLSLEEKLVSTSDRPSVVSTIFGVSPQAGAKTNFAADFCTIRLSVPQSIFVELFAQKNKGMTCLNAHVQH